MATYKSDKVSSPNAGNTPTIIPARVDGRGQVVVEFNFAVAVAFLVNDILQLCNIPKAAVVLDLAIASGGTQASNADSVFTVGDTASANRFITTAAGLALRGAAGSISRMDNPAGVGFVYTADDVLQLKITTVGTGQTTGGYVNGWIEYRMGA